MMGHVLGVDGGNTKTDFLLFTLEGKLVDVMRTGTCSHEAEDMGYDNAYALLAKHIDCFLARNHISVTSIKSAAFGLAGIDLPHQYEAMHSRIKQMGIKNFVVANDSILGIKAISSNGTGLCSVNGTGTVTSGIDSEGKIVQIGGIGEMCDDKAGGTYIATKAVQAVYNQLFRCGQKTSITEAMFTLLGCKTEEEFVLTIANDEQMSLYVSKINILLQQQATKRDAVAEHILKEVGIFLGKSAAGCVKRLTFHERIDIVFIGSVWVKGAYDGMKEAFEKTFSSLIDLPFSVTKLTSPPATGAIIWALMLADHTFDYTTIRNVVLQELTNAIYEKMVFQNN